MAAGLRLAGNTVGDADGSRVVVLLTDGMPSDAAGTIRERDALVDAGFGIVTRGVKGADASFLARLSTGDGELLDVTELSSSFRGIARQLATSAGAGNHLTRGRARGIGR